MFRLAYNNILAARGRVQDRLSACSACRTSSTLGTGGCIDDRCNLTLGDRRVRSSTVLQGSGKLLAD